MRALSLSHLSRYSAVINPGSTITTCLTLGKLLSLYFHFSIDKMGIIMVTPLKILDKILR